MDQITFEKKAFADTNSDFVKGYYQALVLAITTKDKTLQKECEDMAALFAPRITKNQVKLCKQRIEFILGVNK